MRLKRFLAFTLLLFLTAFPALAAASVLQPTDDFYVCDSADVLDEATEGHIVLNNDALYEACGAQIVIVTVESTGTTSLEDYAYTLFNDWGIGSSSRNNGLLLVMAIADDDYWLVQGTGLQDYITAGDLDDMLFDELEPSFAEKDYSTGARKLFDALFDTVARVYNLSLSVDNSLYEEYTAQYGNTSDAAVVNPPTQRKEGSSFMSLLAIIIICIIVVCVCSARRPRHTHHEHHGVPPIIITPRPPRPPRPHHPPMNHPPHNPGGPAPHRPSGFGGGMSRSSSRPSGFGGGRPSGGSRPSGFGGGRSGGGGMSRGGGAGRHR